MKNSTTARGVLGELNDLLMANDMYIRNVTPAERATIDTDEDVRWAIESYNPAVFGPLTYVSDLQVMLDSARKLFGA